MQVDPPPHLPGPTPKTLEEDLFGAAPPVEPKAPPAVLAREAHDLEELPSGPMAGVVETARSDVEEDPESDDDAGGLFGDDDDDEIKLPQPVLPRPKEEDDDGLSDDERARRAALEYDEPPLDSLEDPLVYGYRRVEQQSIAQVELANFGLPAHEKVWHAKLPSFLGLETGAFDGLAWETPEEDPDDVVLDLPGELKRPGQVERKKKTVVPDEYVIRWRWTKDKDGNPIKESNARFIRWNDGSLSLQIGSELFDVSASLDHSALLASTGLTIPPPVPGFPPPPPSSYSPAPGHGTSYLTVDHPYCGLIEAQASIHGSLSITPTTLQSATHRRLAGAISKRYERKTAVKEALSLDEDPERKKLEREKADAEKERKRRKEKIKGQRKAGGSRAGGAHRRATRMVGSEDEDQEDAEMGQESGEDDDMMGGKGRRSQPKRGAGGPLAREDEYDEEDGFVVQSGSESDAQVEPEYSEDEMDAIEQNAEKEERRRKDAAKASRDGRESSPPVVQAAPRRRMVVDDDEDDE